MRQLILAGMFILAACGPAGDREGRDRGAQDHPSASKTLTLALNGEPDFFVLGIGGAAIAGIGGGGLQGAVHQSLATYDQRGEAHPRLAMELPSQETGTWIVRPDGTMRTIFSLRQDVTWHDGHPLAAADFVLGWTVSRDAEIATSNRFVAERIGEIDLSEPHSLAIEWKTTYPFANALVENQLLALPVHLLEETYRASKERFSQLGYWTREFVGLGPYRLAEWEAGSHLTLRAYDAFYLGRARIDTVVVRFIPSEPTIVANLLARSVDGVLKGSLSFEDAVGVKNDWERMGQKPSFIAPTTHRRMLSVQFRPEIASPPEILDVRLRRALLHAIDRQSLVDALLAGLAPISDTFIPPDDVRWSAVQEALVRYDYSVTRAQQLTAELGWSRPDPSARPDPSGRGADGSFTRGSAEPATIQIRSTPGQEKEITIVADFWRAAGFAVEERPLSIGESRDQRLVSLFPAIHYASLPLSFQQDLQRVHGRLCPTEATNWTGTNRGCYVNTSMDRVADALQIAIEPREQQQLWRELVRVQSEDLPLLPLYFNIQVELYRQGLAGAVGTARPEGSQTWNIAEWDLN